MNRKRGFVPIGVLAVAVLLLLTPSLAAAPPQAVPGEAGGSPAAVVQYDSGWEAVGQGACRTFTHNLGGNVNDYAAEVWFLDTPGDNDGVELGINRRGFGGLDVNGQHQGANWQELTASSIAVCRGADDLAADQVRVRVWVPDPPDYASPWTPIGQGDTITFDHNLGVSADDLTVGLWFRGTTRGIHGLGYGGLPVSAGQEFYGADWHHLTDNQVRVTRHADDDDVEEVRVVVTQADEPAWDSGWQAAAIGANPLTHNLSWNPSLFLVRAECRSTGQGIHHIFSGGAVHWAAGRQGAHLQNLSANSVVAFRWQDDQVCPEARVRIWKRGTLLFLPLVLRGP